MHPFPFSRWCTAVVEQANIVRVSADAIVNAANEQMLGGLGVDGAIHEAAGPQLVEACREVPEVRPGVRCPRGEARITPGFRLPCKYVIHAVGPIFESHAVSAPILASAYRSSLELANQHQLQSLAFPAISCGAYCYPVADAARIAILTCREHAGNLQEIRFVLFSEDNFEAWLAVAKELLNS